MRNTNLSLPRVERRNHKCCGTVYMQRVEQSLCSWWCQTPQSRFFLDAPSCRRQPAGRKMFADSQSVHDDRRTEWGLRSNTLIKKEMSASVQSTRLPNYQTPRPFSTKVETCQRWTVFLVVGVRNQHYREMRVVLSECCLSTPDESASELCS